MNIERFPLILCKRKAWFLIYLIHMLEIKEINYERVVLVGLITQEQSEEKLEEYMEELAFLAYTAGAETSARFTQRLNKPDPKYFVGSGKLAEIKEYCVENEVETLIFDDELSPSQLKNIEKFMDIKIMDRTNLILDIFAQRAQTSYARTQVELAQYEYLLPRLTRMWTHLERQRGGIGMRGPGETEIETDRRIIRDRITLLKKKLEKIDRQMATQRTNRGQLVRVALVGYTNVGKSTLMNVLSKSEVFAEDKLFATLDTTVRKVVIGNLPFLLTDTVGFIRKLPTQLIESFKSTLDEVREADLILHVIDISHSSFEDHMRSVNETLEDIESKNKPTILIFNKIDQFKQNLKEAENEENEEEDFQHYTLDELKKMWVSKSQEPSVFISAFDGTNIEELKKTMYEEIKSIHETRFPYNNYLFNYYDHLEEE